MTTSQTELRHPNSPSHDLNGQHVVVVGGKTGIGLGMALAAHAAGASVTVASRRTASVADLPELASFGSWCSILVMRTPFGPPSTLLAVWIICLSPPVQPMAAGVHLWTKT